METPATILKDEGDEHKSLSVEAKCIKIGEPEMDSSNIDMALGIENAKKFTLADLDSTTAVIKLAGLTTANSNRRKLTEEAISQQIERLLVSKEIFSPPSPSQEPAPPPAPQSPRDDREEEKERQRNILKREVEQLKVQQMKDFNVELAMLATRRAAAITAINAEHDSIQDEQLRQLPINAELEDAEKALDRLVRLSYVCLTEDL